MIDTGAGGLYWRILRQNECVGALAIFREVCYTERNIARRNPYHGKDGTINNGTEKTVSEREAHDMCAVVQGRNYKQRNLK